MKLVSSILDGDVEAYVESFTDDGVLMHPESPQVRGETAIRAYVSAVFSAVKVTHLELTPSVVEGGGGFAFEVGVQRVAVEPSDDKFKTERQHLHVYRKQSDGSWRIAAAMSGNQ
jgi:uncharacterized protein (TIGR02246 family)